ncbi:MFS transporter [Chloroflexota bacterium]
MSYPRFRFKGREVFYGWGIVAALFLVMFVFMGGFYSFGVFFNSLSLEFDSTATITSGIMSLSMILGGLFGWVMGGLTDRYGPRMVLALSSFLAGAGYLLMTRIDSIWQIYVLIGIVVGIAMSSAYVVPGATIGKWFIKKRGLAMGITFAAIGIAQVVVPPLVAQLIELRDWRFAYLIMGLLVLVLGVSASMFLRRTPEDVGLLPNGEVTKQRSSMEVTTLAGYTVAETLHTSAFWIFCAMWALMAMPVLLVAVHIVPYATSMEIGSVAAASILTVIGAANISGKFIFGYMVDRIGSRAALCMTRVIQSAALLLFVYARDLRLFYIAALLFGVSYSGGDIICLDMLAEVFGRKYLGIIIGVTSVTWRIGAAIGPIMGGLVYDVTGSYSSAFLAAAIGIATCIGLAFVFFAQKPRLYSSRAAPLE